MLTKQLSMKGMWLLIHRLEQQHLTRCAQQLRAATETAGRGLPAARVRPGTSGAAGSIQTNPRNGRRRWALLQTCIDEQLRRYQARLPTSLSHQLQATSETAALFARRRKIGSPTLNMRQQLRTKLVYSLHSVRCPATNPNTYTVCFGDAKSQPF